MILVDTSVWIEHFRVGGSLAALLEPRTFLIHPFVIGELALGDLRPRVSTIQTLQELPQAPVAANDEVLQLIERQRLFGLGIGYVDAHLLASVLLAGDATLWTNDKNLRAAAEKLGLAHSYHS